MPIITRAFKWGAAEELVPANVYHAIRTVEGLRKGRTTAREPDPVLPVDDAAVEATLPALPKIVADMVRFQRLTGCRPGEVCQLRPIDVDRSGQVWEFRPASHKTEHHGRERVIFIGPKAQAVILPYLLREATAHCFGPAESEAKRHEEMRARQAPSVDHGMAVGRDPHKEARDKWMHAEATKRGTAYNKISHLLKTKKPFWESLSPNGVKKTIIAYCDRNGLPRPAPRKSGRRTQE